MTSRRLPANKPSITGFERLATNDAFQFLTRLPSSQSGERFENDDRLREKLKSITNPI